MNIKTLKNLKKGDMVLCTKSYISFISNKKTNTFTKGKIYEVGGDYWPEAKKRIENINSTKDLNKFGIGNCVAVKKDDLGVANGWRHQNFIKVTSEIAAKVLFGDNNE